MAAVVAKQWVYVLYSDGDELWHQRLVLGRVASSVAEFSIATPDDDVYVEDYSGDDPDIAAVRWSDVHRPAPPGLNRGRVYRFRADPPDARKAALRREGAEAARERWEEIAAAANDGRQYPPGGALEAVAGAQGGAAGPGAIPPAGAGAVAGAAAPGAAGGGGGAGLPPGGGGGGAGGPVWVTVETTPQHPRGTVVTPNAGALLRGDVGMYDHGGGVWLLVRRMDPTAVAKFTGAEAAGDARLLQVQLAPATAGAGVARKRRAWRDVVDILTVCTFSDWPIAGPRSVEWCAQFINRRGGGPQDHHRFFKHTYGLTKTDWGVDAHGIIMHMLEEAGGYDGTEVCSLASMEVAMRHAQLVEYVYVQEGAAKEIKSKGKKGKGSSAGLLDEASIFLGARRETCEAMTCPALLEYVAGEVEKDASIMKQVRKARDERRLLGKELGGEVPTK